MRVGIFGAGQAGLMVTAWLPAVHTPVCYVDNNPKKQGTMWKNLPVFSPAEAIEQQLDLIWIAVLNREAAEAIEKQLRDLGYAGEILKIKEWQAMQDVRVAALRLMAGEIARRRVPGAVAELGVFRGDFAAVINEMFPDRPMYLFDTFQGFDERDLKIEEEAGTQPGHYRDFSETSMELVRQRLPHPEQAIFCPGYFPESLTEELPELAFVSLDPDLYEPTLRGLEVFWPRLSPGGAIFIHDYNSMQFPGVRKAVEEFCQSRGLFVIPLMDLHGTAVLMRQG